MNRSEVVVPAGGRKFRPDPVKTSLEGIVGSGPHRRHKRLPLGGREDDIDMHLATGTYCCEELEQAPCP